MTTRTQENTTMCSIPCNLCDSTSVEIISLKDRNGDYLRTIICKKCGLIWSDPRPRDEKIKEFYSTNYRKEYKGITKPKKKHVYRDAKEAMKRYNFFKDLLKKEDRLLDIGAGNGVFVYSLRSIGVDAKGIEPDENHARYAREELKIPVQTGFAQEVNEKESIHIVTLNHVLEHLTDPLAELKNIWEILKEKGYLIVDVPNAEDLKHNFKNRYHKAHIYTFNPETLVALGERAGFKTVRKNIAPLCGNISVIFQKTDGRSNSNIDLGGNALKIKEKIYKHTSLRHFTSTIPYNKILLKAFMAITEQIAIRKFSNDKEIIDSVVSGKIGR